MNRSYDDLINILKVKESVPPNIFNSVIFSIQNKEAIKQENDSKRMLWFFSPLVTSLIVFMVFVGVKVGIDNSQINKYSDRLVSMSDSDYYDRFFLTINNDFVF